MANTRFNPKARAKEIARELEAARKKQEQYEEAIDAVVGKEAKPAARTRAEFVEMLYDHFGIEESPRTPRKDKNGNVMKKKGTDEAIMTPTDRDESERIEKLAAKFEQLVSAAERSQQAVPQPR